MSTKGPWEERVGKLLDPRKHPDFVYSYKPPDNMHGGQPLIDWHACDSSGRYWLIEVKELAQDRATFNMTTDITAGQRDGLTGIAGSMTGLALLAIGHRSVLYVFDWRVIQWQPTPSRLPMSLAFLSYHWTGPKSWTHNLYADVTGRPPTLAPTPRLLGGASRSTDRSR